VKLYEHSAARRLAARARVEATIKVFQALLADARDVDEETHQLLTRLDTLRYCREQLHVGFTHVNRALVIATRMFEDAHVPVRPHSWNHKEAA
jgi:hypothetical protein